MSYQKVIVANTADNPIPVTGGGGGGSDELLQEISNKLTILINVIDIRLSAILTATDGTKNQLGLLNMKWQESVDGTNPLWCNRDKIKVNFRHFARPGTSVGDATWNALQYSSDVHQPALNGFHVRETRPLYTAPTIETSQSPYFSDDSLDSCAAPLVFNYGAVSAIFDATDPDGKMPYGCGVYISDRSRAKGQLSNIGRGPLAFTPIASVSNPYFNTASTRELDVSGLLKDHKVQEEELAEASFEIVKNNCKI